MSETPEIPVEVEWARGMEIEVTYEEERWEQLEDGSHNEFTVEETDTGYITSVPSRKFDWEQDDVAFDYQLVMNGREGTVRSVDLTAGQVLQLIYEGGGDRDWNTFTLKKIRVVGSR
jgi:hypothetical protein